MKAILFIIMAVIIATQTGCMAPTSLQSGRTIGKGNSVLTMAGTHGKFDQISSTQDEDSTDDYEPVVEVGRIYGISDKVDVGLKFNSASFLSLQVKGQFIGNQNSLFASSVGVEMGTSPLGLLNGINDFYLTVPLYVSVHPFEYFGVYGTPRFIVIKHRESLTIAGLSYGLVIGKKTKVYMEASHFYKDFSTPSQFSIGFSTPME